MSNLLLFLHLTEDGVYNAVWDENLLLCYSLLHCKCGKQVGVSVYSSNSVGDSESLNGKVSTI